MIFDIASSVSPVKKVSLSVNIVSEVLSLFFNKLNKESIASLLCVNKLTYTDSYSLSLVVAGSP
ncbi:hypothetical protein VCHA53O473_20039 [Vibrio chagasii]|nr:hypothetical protein VCHA53O473_20039 [Vibrio chagasii]